MGWAWFSDLQHVVAVAAPLGVPVLLGVRVMGAIEDWRIRRLQRRIMEQELKANETKKAA